jgi:RNA polymerase sigma-70 factor (ECF subfamily)
MSPSNDDAAMTKARGAGHQSGSSWAAGREGDGLDPGTLDDSVDRDAGDELRLAAAAGHVGPHPSVPFEEVYERYFEFVWRSLRMLGVSRASLDDAVQDVFGTIARQLPRFEGRSSLRTWVFGIAQYTASNHRRSTRRKSAPLEPLDEGMVSDEPGPHAHAEAKQLADVIFRFCEELDEGRRAVFVLGLLEEVPAAEIAELLEIPVNTVYSRSRTLKQALRQRLEQREPRELGSLHRNRDEVEQ